MSLREYLTQQRQRVDAALERWAPHESTPPGTIHKAMRYSLFAGEKRIRPVLCMAAAEIVSDEIDGVEDAACSLELIHTYSLIHDDLPALDNDDLRRGRPTSHKVFGDAMAILAGDSLLTLAFQVLAQLRGVDAARKSRLIEELATASGTVGGMIAGQVHDLEGEGQTPDARLLDTIHRAKTGALLRASLRMGAIYAAPRLSSTQRFRAMVNMPGSAFQIVDDLLDVEQSSEEFGKTAGKDAAQKKVTFPAVYGLERSREMAEQERVRCHEALSIFGGRARWLRELADLIVQRKN